MKTSSFERFGGLCAFIAGVGGLCYSVSFVILIKSAPAVSNILTPLLLLVGGLLSSAVMLALYQRLRETEATFALWAAILGMVAALGSAMHGGYDLANAINPPALSASSQTDLNALPSQVDPRGLLTFGVTGLAFLVVAWLMARGGLFPRGLGYLGYALAMLLMIVYLGRLILLQPNNPFLLGAATLTGFLPAPLWYIWLGVVFWHGQQKPHHPDTVCAWVHRYQQAGLAGLRMRAGRGRKLVFSPQPLNRRKLRERLCSSSRASQAGLARSRWWVDGVRRVVSWLRGCCLATAWHTLASFQLASRRGRAQCIRLTPEYPAKVQRMAAITWDSLVQGDADRAPG